MVKSEAPAAIPMPVASVPYTFRMCSTAPDVRASHCVPACCSRSGWTYDGNELLAGAWRPRFRDTVRIGPGPGSPGVTRGEDGMVHADAKRTCCCGLSKIDGCPRSGSFSSTSTRFFVFVKRELKQRREPAQVSMPVHRKVVLKLPCSSRRESIASAEKPAKTSVLPGYYPSSAHSATSET